MSLSAKLYNLQEGVRIAVESIVGNKVRAGLTILGVAVGVFVVVVKAAAARPPAVERWRGAKHKISLWPLRRVGVICIGSRPRRFLIWERFRWW